MNDQADNQGLIRVETRSVGPRGIIVITDIEWVTPEQFAAREAWIERRDASRRVFEAKWSDDRDQLQADRKARADASSSVHWSDEAKRAWCEEKDRKMAEFLGRARGVNLSHTDELVPKWRRLDFKWNPHLR